MPYITIAMSFLSIPTGEVGSFVSWSSMVGVGSKPDMPKECALMYFSQPGCAVLLRVL